MKYDWANHEKINKGSVLYTIDNFDINKIVSIKDFRIILPIVGKNIDCKVY